MWELTFPRTVVIGEGALEYLKEVEGMRVLIVTDKVIHKLDFVEKLATSTFTEQSNVLMVKFDSPTVRRYGSNKWNSRLVCIELGHTDDNSFACFWLGYQ